MEGEAPGITTLALAGGWLGLTAFPAPGEALARLLHWRPDLVLSLTPLEEMALLGGSDLPPRLAAGKIGWLHLPVADFGTPGPDAAWPVLSARIRARLATGGRVVIHCRAGCGRTGMIALRLMVETGEAPLPALARLRAVRPCAVETDAQYRWAATDQPATG
ncbi:protein-tyrosine phosphatase family protein [Szabonella alba]|uniref:Dual specificity protein phosphatase family protein n=1 Tax=Szabonella alba TaxID=2804194 RepID=A0A8K0VBE0_9RHOB|nr:protein-tyrosine phosphatase family protein [Szabonella alba]MBL4916060.1 dual specificity protein phosphatase family protein [Szabonella alba]